MAMRYSKDHVELEKREVHMREIRDWQMPCAVVCGW
jgi:hypothetical protein